MIPPRHKGHKITHKEAVTIVDRWVTLRLDMWKTELQNQLVGAKVYPDNKLHISIAAEIDGLAVLMILGKENKDG